MITLITGGPGTGKTAWILAELLKLRKAEPDREIYIHGIRNLRGIAHEQIYCRSQLCDICRSQTIPDNAKYVETWPEWKTSGSLIVVDEVQRIWRPRAGGGNPPESVSGLETHRHYGLDFWLISQGPHLFDNFIRLLVGKHVHLVAKWNGRTQYEWPECQQNVQNRGDAVTRPYTLPKHVYSMYDSAEIHTKQNKRVPLALYAFVAVVLVSVGLGVRAYHSITSRMNPEDAAPVGAVAPAGAAEPAANTATLKVATPDNSPGQKTVQTFPDFKPTIPGVPESAPAYSGLLKVQQAPILAGCVKTKTDCKCYTQQATPYPANEAYCNEVIAGNRFNPYLKPYEPPKVNQASPEPKEPEKREQLAVNDDRMPR